MEQSEFDRLNGKTTSKERHTRISFDLITTGTEAQRDQAISKLISEINLQGFQVRDFRANGRSVR